MGLFYNYAKYNTRLVSKAFFTKVRISGEQHIPVNKPVLLALNHPNSFLDAVVVGGHLKRETHFLARGDAFHNKYAKPILHSLNMLPIFRLSEGKENLERNNETFDACQAILDQNKMVILFAEGLCVNNWDLRPMRKGLARIALKAWKSKSAATNLEVIPVGLTYEHYEGEGKVLLINIGTAIQKEQVDIFGNEALFVKNFNQLVFEGLEKLIPVMPKMLPGDEQHHSFRAILQESATYNEEAASVIADIKSGKLASVPASNTKWIKDTFVFFPLYLFSQWIAQKMFKQKLFHDSVIFGLLLFLWPVYLLMIWLILKLIF
jgi:1-acyl-sn-glycerol-3-phosphate acyltransferase